MRKVQRINKNHYILLISTLWSWDNKSFEDVLSNKFYRRILEDYDVGQTDSAKINVLQATNFAISIWTKMFGKRK